MVSLDPPEHTRVRRHTARAFTPRRVAAMEGTIRATVERAARRGRPGATVRSRRGADLPAAGDDRLHASSACRPRTTAQLKRWCGYRAGLTFGRPPPEEQVAHAENIVAYRRYLRGLVDERVERRADDLTSALIDIHDEDPEALTLDEIASICFSLSFAGHETTNYLIGNVMRRLLEDRARWERIVAEPEAIPGAVEETLRFDPSVCVWRRVTTRPTTVGGVDLPAGAKLFLWLAAAGRDAVGLPRARRLRRRPRERPPPPRLRPRHPLLPRLGARQARSRAGRRGARAPLAASWRWSTARSSRSTRTSRSAGRRRCGWWLA